MHPKDADIIANSVDPDQIAPLGLHCLPRRMSENLGSLQYISNDICKDFKFSKPTSNIARTTQIIRETDKVGIY